MIYLSPESQRKRQMSLEALPMGQITLTQPRREKGSGQGKETSPRDSSDSAQPPPDVVRAGLQSEAAAA